MISLENYQNKINELMEIHSYVKKRSIKAIIITTILSVLFIPPFIYAGNNDKVGLVIICALAFFGIVVLGIIYIKSLHKSFIHGNLNELVTNIINNETSFNIEVSNDKKINKANLIEKSNFITIGHTPNFIISFNIESKNNPSMQINYNYLDITFSKNVTFSGYLITLPINNINCDCKLFSKNMSTYVYNYKKDKEKSTPDRYRYYYNKKNITELDPKLIDIYNIVFEKINNEYINDFIPMGICCYNNYLTILISSVGSKRINYGFKYKFNEEVLKQFIDTINNDLKMINKIEEYLK